MIESNLDARTRHEDALKTAGYVVLDLENWFAAELPHAAVLLSDLATFHWLQEQHVRGLPPTIVLAADEKAGVTACLCGAAAWAPVDGDEAYLVDTVESVLK